MSGITLKIPVQPSSQDGFYALTKNIKENTKQALKMIVLTSPGERIMLPTFGVGIKQYLFELNKEVVFNEIKSDIEEQVSIWMPFLNIDIIEVYQDAEDDETRLSLYIRYSIPDLDIADQLIVN